MKTLKELLTHTDIRTDGVSVRILCDGLDEREEMFTRLTNIASGIASDNEEQAAPISSAVEFNPVTQVVCVKALLVYDDEGNYFIHGTSKDDPSTMFKSMAGIWSFDPSKEMVREIELDLELPRVDGVMKPKVL